MVRQVSNGNETVHMGSIDQLGSIRGTDAGRLRALQREVRPRGEQLVNELDPR